MKIKKLSEIGVVIKGVSFDKGEAVNAPITDYIPILRAGNITYSGLDLENDILWVPKSRVSATQMLEPDDIVICMSSGSAAVLGKTAQLSHTWHGSVGAFCAIIRFRDEINPKYGSYWLKSPAFIQWRDSQAKGANIQNLRKSSIEELQIPLPPLAEQERIVCLLDEAEGLRKLRTQASARMEDFVPALFHEMFGDPITNPKRWQIVEARSLFMKMGYGVGTPPPFASKGLIFLRAMNIKPKGINLKNMVYFSNEHADSLSRSKVNTGDVVIVRRGAYTGDTAVIPEHLDGAYVGYDIILRPDKNKILGEWFARLVNSPSMMKHIYQIRERAAQQGLNVQQIGNIQVPLPPLPLQHQFTQRVQEAREIQSRQAQSAERIETLYQSMLSRAFAGEL
jgi:type I restriction enzyme S subunit